MNDTNWPIANPDDAEIWPNLYLFSFGQMGTIHVYVWADSLDAGFEEAVEWLDDQGYCGYFTTITEEELRDSADELGIPWPGIDAFTGTIEKDAGRILEHAEADLTIIDHTTLKCEKDLGGPAYIPSYEWFVNEVTDDRTFRKVKKRSLKRDIKIPYSAYVVLRRYRTGSSDPLHIVLFRRGNLAHVTTVTATPTEIEALKEAAEEAARDKRNTASERRAVKKFREGL